MAACNDEQHKAGLKPVLALQLFLILLDCWHCGLEMESVACVKAAPEAALKLRALGAFKARVVQDPCNVTMFTVYPLDAMQTRMATGQCVSVSGCFSAVKSAGGGGA